MTTPVRGFTLVEMMVVLAIIVIITTIALLGQSSFNRSMVLTDTAYTIAFSVREAQALGISSRAFAGTQDAGYGIHFANLSPTSYKLFADTYPIAPGDTQYTAICPGHPNVATSNPEAKPGDCIQTLESEVVRTYSLNNGFRVSGFCGRQSNGVQLCNGAIDALDIVYLRPNTQSVITGVNGGTRTALVDATIRVTSPDGVDERCIYVSRVGQVSVVQKGETECP
ncbi:MAG: putative Type pilus pilin [Patescibacteria group bacterium]|nr:putative Type pilus pilin [Patescibacteria group bacterium]